MAPPGRIDLPALADKLAANGPVKQEPANRRIRALFGGEWLFDTLQAQYVWEHPHFPTFYVPFELVESRIVYADHRSRDYWIGWLTVAGKQSSTFGFLQGPLGGLVRIPMGEADAMFAEDERLLGGHPKDPYKRIECLQSSREVRIEVDGVVVARSTNNVFLHETGLRTRYYLPETAILDWSMVSPSDTTTVCPYKGEAGYYHLKVGDKEIKDAIWYYKYPTAESAPIQNRLCFCNEKVDVFVDGVKEN